MAKSNEEVLKVRSHKTGQEQSLTRDQYELLGGGRKFAILSGTPPEAKATITKADVPKGDETKPTPSK